MNQRLNKLKTYLQKKKIDALLVSSVSNIAYLTKFLGFSKDEREAFLLIVAQPQGLTHKTPGVFGVSGYLLTDARYFERVRKAVKDFEVVKVSSINRPLRQLKRLIKKYRIKRLGFEKHNLTVGELEKIKSLPDLSAELVPTENIVENLRIIKEPEEILAIEKACQLGDRTFKYLLKKISKLASSLRSEVKPGMTEKQLAFEIEFFIKKHGADIAFPPIVAFGANSSIPHHQTGKNILGPSTRFTRSGREGQIILLDFGVRLNNYCSDMTRVVFLGKATNEQKHIYETVLQAQKRAIEYLAQTCRITSDGGPERSRRDSSEVDRLARKYITSYGYPTIPHSLGHGVGLEVHELPHLSLKNKDILKPGMVFSLEPGIYLPGKFGIRIEDLVVLEKTGPRILTKATKEIIEL